MAQIARSLRGRTKKRKKRKGATNQRKVNYNRPKERSSKLPVKLFEAKELSTKKSFSRDPRFDRLSGKLNYDLYSKSYAFLDVAQEQRNKEFTERLKKLKKGKKKKQDYEELKEEFALEKQNQGRRQELERKMKIKREAKQENKQRAKKGLKPLFQKKKVKKEE